VIPLIPTQEDCDRLITLVHDRFGCRVVDKRTSPVAQEIAKVLDALKIMDAEKFLNGYCTTLPIFDLTGLETLKVWLESGAASTTSQPVTKSILSEGLMAALRDLSTGPEQALIMMNPIEPSRYFDVLVHEATHGGPQISYAGPLHFAVTYLVNENARAVTWEGPAYATTDELAILRGTALVPLAGSMDALKAYRCSDAAVRAAEVARESCRLSALAGVFSPVVAAVKEEWS
jgi:hypothetical protein